MLVKNLIAVLSEMPPEAQIAYVSDGGVGHYVQRAWLAQSGIAVLSDYEEPVYRDEDRPVGAPTAAMADWSSGPEPSIT